MAGRFKKIKYIKENLKMGAEKDTARDTPDKV